jgi:3-keto-disaccharide hydrolase
MYTKQLVLILLPCWLVASGLPAEEKDAGKRPAVRSKTENRTPWRPLFNGKDLSGWKLSRFGGDGEVLVENGQIMIEMGATLSGIKYTEKLPRTDYEVRLEAKRVAGNDFFCGLTFPVEKSHCTLIVGGWAGGVVGLSTIDGQDASANETTRYIAFEKDRWYRIKIRVTSKNITAWIDQKPIFTQPIQGRTVSMRPETFASRPLGIATWQTTAALRNIELRHLRPPELPPDAGHDTIVK